MRENGDLQVQSHTQLLQFLRRFQRRIEARRIPMDTEFFLFPFLLNFVVNRRTAAVTDPRKLSEESGSREAGMPASTYRVFSRVMLGVSAIQRDITRCNCALLLSRTLGKESLRAICCPGAIVRYHCTLKFR